MNRFYRIAVPCLIGAAVATACHLPALIAIRRIPRDPQPLNCCLCPSDCECSTFDAECCCRRMSQRIANHDERIGILESHTGVCQ